MKINKLTLFTVKWHLNEHILNMILAMKQQNKHVFLKMFRFFLKSKLL